MQSLLKIESYEYASPDLLWYFNNRRPYEVARHVVMTNRAIAEARKSGKLVVLSSRRAKTCRGV